MLRPLDVHSTYRATALQLLCRPGILDIDGWSGSSEIRVGCTPGLFIRDTTFWVSCMDPYASPEGLAADGIRCGWNRVQQLSYTRVMSVGFRPTEEDLRVIEANRRADEKTSDVIRRALRLLDREAWEESARADMHRLRSEDLSAEADAWEYDADGNIRIGGTSLTVPARPQDRA